MSDFILFFSSFFPSRLTFLFRLSKLGMAERVKIDLTVMESLLFGHNVSRVYDLKGTVFFRMVTDSKIIMILFILTKIMLTTWVLQSFASRNLE